MHDDRKRRYANYVAWLTATGLLTLALPEAALSATPSAPAAGEAAWREESGSCHVPYPGWALPASSWRAVMGGLEKHFGTDASLDAAVAAEIGRYLESHAGRTGKDSSSATQLRITETAWFQREHREVTKARWSSAEVKSAANCQACHKQAAQGVYEEEEGEEHEHKRKAQ